MDEDDLGPCGSLREDAQRICTWAGGTGVPSPLAHSPLSSCDHPGTPLLCTAVLMS